MKKVFAVVLIVAAGLSLGSMAYAAWCNGGYGPGAVGPKDIQALKSFQKETLPLRDELVAKRLEIQNEYAKDNPDQNRIASLQKETIDLRTKIQDVAKKYDLSDRGSGWTKGRGDREWGFMMGRGYGRGYRNGYGSDYCPMW